MSINEEAINFCNYIKPILNSCTGFIKSDGYVTHFPGTLVAMNEDETQCCIIKIPVIFNFYMTAIIRKFLSLKSPEEFSNFEKETYFLGWNIKRQNLIRYFEEYSNIDNTCACIYHNPNCYDLNNFSEIVSNVDIGRMNVITCPDQYFMIPVSKSITPLSKSDTVGLRIYKRSDYQNISTIRYTMFKKKFNLTVDMFMNCIM